jgi:RsiW-degrading membrane proteinase PrsW (M82 family)
MSDPQTIFYAFLGGVLPAVLWLLFWLREDSKKPEPKGKIIETFIAGMAAVVIVLPFQKLVANNFPGLGFVPFLLWALIEEVFKLVAAYVVAIRSRDDDEPIDTLIYMITAALGFVALENTLFIWNPLFDQNVTTALITGGTRFLGASLLHTISSGTVGIALALAFYKSRIRKISYCIIGLAIAVAIHTAFNLLILGSLGGSLEIFAAVWIGVTFLLFFFEKVKTIAP